MYAKVAEVAVGVGVVDGLEVELQLLRGEEAELGKEVQVLVVKVWASRLEEVELVVG